MPSMPALKPSPGGPRTLVIYACDAGYAWPTLVSARSVKAHASIDVDIRIFATDYAPARFAQAEAAAAAFGAKVVPLSASAFMQFDVARFRPFENFEHLNTSVLSRLVTGEHIPDDYDQVLYLDGDTLCVGDLAPLLQYRAPAGRLLATADSFNYLKNDNGRYAAVWRRYIESFGMAVDDVWYNSGVMMAERRTWAERGRAALAYFFNNVERCRFPVDSATNMASRDELAPLSCRWNFMAPMRMWGLDATIQPRLYHFTGRDKPWLGPLAPWREFWPRYRDLEADPLLAPLAVARADKARVGASNRHSALTRLKQATVHRARAERARRRLLEAEANALV